MAAASVPAQQLFSTRAEERFVLRGVDWPTYRKISDALTGRHLRITYDRGRLEFCKVSFARGHCGALLSRFICVVTEEFGLPICSCGDMTCDREDLERGLEPDEGFYIENEPLIRDKEEIDLAVDPPPDLTVEVDLSRSPKSRMSIYAAIRVPEVWRFDGETLKIHQLGGDGQYVVVERSPHFPIVSGADIVRFLQMRTQTDENTLVRLFRGWVREQLLARGKQP